jgi:hypothetical protein
VVTSLTHNDIDTCLSSSVTCRSTVAVLRRQRNCAVGSLSMLGKRVRPVLLAILPRVACDTEPRSQTEFHNFPTTTFVWARRLEAHLARSVAVHQLIGRNDEGAPPMGRHERHLGFQNAVAALPE